MFSLDWRHIHKTVTNYSYSSHWKANENESKSKSEKSSTKRKKFFGKNVCLLRRHFIAIFTQYNCVFFLSFHFHRQSEGWDERNEPTRYLPFKGTMLFQLEFEWLLFVECKTRHNSLKLCALSNGMSEFLWVERLQRFDFGSNVACTASTLYGNHCGCIVYSAICIWMNKTKISNRFEVINLNEFQQSYTMSSTNKVSMYKQYTIKLETD